MCQCSGGGSAAAVQQSTSRSSRSGAFTASHIPTMPPSESPQNETRSRPSSSSSSRTSAAQVVERVRAVGHRRAAVPTPVVADEPEAGRQSRDLRIPQCVRRPERGREQEWGSVGWAVDAMVQLHASTPLGSATPRTARARGRRARRPSRGTRPGRAPPRARTGRAPSAGPPAARRGSSCRTRQRGRRRRGRPPAPRRGPAAQATGRRSAPRARGRRSRRGCGASASASTSSDSSASAERAQRAARVGERARERIPFRLPRARGALVLLLERAGQDRRVRRGEPAAARASAERDGFRFCGIVEERPPSPSATSPTSVCASRITSQRDLRGDAGGGRQRGAELGDPRPVRVPGEHRRVQAELSGVEVERA